MKFSWNKLRNFFGFYKYEITLHMKSSNKYVIRCDNMKYKIDKVSGRLVKLRFIRSEKGKNIFYKVENIEAIAVKRL